MAEETAKSKKKAESFVKEKGTKIVYNQRVQIKITKDYKHLKKGMVLKPHLLHAEFYIKEGVAEKIK